MRWSETQVARLKKLCFSGVSNMDIAAELNCKVTDVYAKRSQLGITIDKVQNALIQRRGDKGKAQESLIFENDNGSRYFIVAGDDEEALLREMSRGGYVIVWGLDRVRMCWNGGSYYGADEFEVAAKRFLDGRDEKCE